MAIIEGLAAENGRYTLMARAIVLTALVVCYSPLGDEAIQLLRKQTEV
jgi:hypothetical protein